MLTSIAVIPDTGLLSSSDVRRFVAALDKQIRRDFSPVWGKWAVPYVAGTADRLPESTWKLYLVDRPSSSAEAGGYGRHRTEGKQHTPTGIVFVEVCLQHKESWTEIASHETLEMLADEWVNLDVVRQRPGGALDLWPREVCDPVQGTPYQIDGVDLANFVYPEFFIEGADGPYDHRRVLTKPFELCETGYASIMFVAPGSSPQRRDVYGKKCPDWRQQTQQDRRVKGC